MNPARLFLILVATSLSHAADLTPQLGTLSEKLLEETFTGPEVPKGWAANTGSLRIVDGTLRAAEKSSDMHIGAFRYRLPLQDCAIQLDFKLGDARIINLGFDPAPGELKKNGHLFSVTISKTGWTLVEHNNKADPASKPKVHAKADTTFDPATTYTLLLECKGDNVVVQIAGKEPLKATAPDFHVKKTRTCVPYGRQRRPGGGVRQCAGVGAEVRALSLWQSAIGFFAKGQSGRGRREQKSLPSLLLCLTAAKSSHPRLSPAQVTHSARPFWKRD